MFLLDTLGELRDAYPCASFAFVGGSLVPAGGHNVLEPAAEGIPVVVGTEAHNFALPKDEPKSTEDIAA